MTTMCAKWTATAIVIVAHVALAMGSVYHLLVDPVTSRWGCDRPGVTHQAAGQFVLAGRNDSE